MGFSYGPFGLCCDFCDRDEPRINVKKITCPYGYCQAWACCIECKAKKLHLQSSCTPEKKTHKEVCKQWQEQFAIEHNLCLRCGNKKDEPAKDYHFAYWPNLCRKCAKQKASIVSLRKMEKDRECGILA